MLRYNTPVEDYRDAYGLMVKREDLSCSPPGPPFSKTRGVWAHIGNIPAKEVTVGVLDTRHSQAGHAVRAACLDYGRDTVNFYPVYKKDPDAIPDAVLRARDLGAKIVGLPAGPSWYLYHQARWWMEDHFAEGDWYLMPNALKLPEMVAETSEEVRKTLNNWPADLPRPERVIIPASSATIAAGVMDGWSRHCPPSEQPHFIIHLGYSRTPLAVARGFQSKGVGSVSYTLVNEKYSYSDAARAGETPPWPCNEFYDLKAFRWWLREGQQNFLPRPTLLWNIG